jgi:hypothetical protein
MNKRKAMLLAAGFIFIVSIVILGFNFRDSTKQNELDPIEAIEASGVYPLMEKEWAINYRVKKQHIYVENIIPRFSFHENASEGVNRLNGYMAVFVDGKWTMNANKSIFILKNMSVGKHKITLQLKKKDGSNYGIKKNIYVHIR